MTVSGTGVINRSGQMQNWLMPTPRIDFAFTNSASAGNLMTYTVNGATQSGDEGASIEFLNTSKAAGATLIANVGSNGGGAGAINFRDTSNGDTSSIVCN